MKKSVIILSIILLSISLTSCHVKTNNQIHKSLNIDNASIIPQNTIPLGFDKYKKRILVAIENKNNQKTELGFYDLNTSVVKPVIKPVNTDKNIINAATDGKYIAWVEASDNPYGNDWIIYAYNIKNGTIKKIDYGKLNEKSASKVSFNQQPNLSLDSSKLVWSTYEMQNNKILCSLILYDLANDKKQVIRSIDGLGNSYIGHPKIFGNYIVWHEGKIEEQSEVGKIYLYNIPNSKIAKISDNGFTPNIYGENIVWVSDKSHITLYNLKTKNTVEIVKGDAVERWFPSLNDTYITWYDNMGILELYNIKTGKLQDFPIKTNNSSSIMGNVLSWTKLENNKGITQFITLSD